MYPGEDLKRLAARKAVLHARIVRERADCAASLAQLVRPLVWIDRIHAQWQAVPPWLKAAAPVVLMALKRRRRKRRPPPRGKIRVVKTILRFAPVAWRLWQNLRPVR